MIPVVIENTRLKLALAIPTGAPIMLEKENNRYSSTCCR